MKRYAILILIFTSQIISQSLEVDQLKNELKTATGSMKVDLLLEIAEEYLPGNTSTSQRYIDEALELAKQYEYFPGIAKSNYLKSRQYFYSGKQDSSKHFLTNSKEIYIKLNDNSGLGYCYSHLAILEYFKGNCNKSLALIDTAKILQTLANNRKGFATALDYEGTIFRFLGKNKEALDNYTRAVKIFEEVDYSKGLFGTYNNLGVIYAELGLNEKAIENFIKASEMDGNFTNIHGVASIYTNIGRLFSRINENPKAIAYLEKAEKYHIQAGNKRGEAVTLENLCNVYLAMNDITAAQQYLTKAKEIYIGINDIQGEANVYIQQGIILHKLEQYTKAIKQFNIALEKYTKINREPKIATIYNLLSKSYIDIENIILAEKYANQALKIAEKNSDLQTKHETLSLLILINEKKGNYNVAYNYQKKFIAVNDSLLNKEKLKSISELEIKHEVTQKEKEITNLSTINSMQELSIKQKNYIIGFIIFVIILGSVFIYVLIKKHRYQKKVNQLLKEKSIKISEQKQQISNVLEELKSTQTNLIHMEKMASLGVMANGLSHQLSNPINFIRGSAITVTYLIDEINSLISNTNINEQNCEGFKQLLKELNELLANIISGSDKAEFIVRSMQTFIQIDDGKKIEVDLNENIESVLMMLNYRLNNNIKINTKLNPLPKLLCNPAQINQVIFNLLNNAIDSVESIENTSNGGAEEITITSLAKLINNNDQIEISVSDNGIGMTDVVKSKIFDPFFTTKENGKGMGLGLTISMNILKNYESKIEVVSSPQNGSTFTILIPIQKHLD